MPQVSAASGSLDVKSIRHSILVSKNHVFGSTRAARGVMRIPNRRSISLKTPDLVTLTSRSRNLQISASRQGGKRRRPNVGVAADMINLAGVHVQMPEQLRSFLSNNSAFCVHLFNRRSLGY